jgi:hypothetical protein
MTIRKKDIFRKTSAVARRFLARSSRLDGMNVLGITALWLGKAQDENMRERGGYYI